MHRFSALLLAAATGGLLVSVSLPATSAPAPAVEIVSIGTLEQTAAKKKAKKGKAAATDFKSCGTYKYHDKKGKCVDARNKK